MPCTVKVGYNCIRAECSSGPGWTVGEHPALCFPCLSLSLSDRCASPVLIDSFNNHFARGPIRSQVLGPLPQRLFFKGKKNTQTPRTIQAPPKSKAGIVSQCLSVP